jgi:hypothetical protein
MLNNFLPCPFNYFSFIVIKLLIKNFTTCCGVTTRLLPYVMPDYRLQEVFRRNAQSDPPAWCFY